MSRAALLAWSLLAVGLLGAMLLVERLAPGRLAREATPDTDPRGPELVGRGSTRDHTATGASPRLHIDAPDPAVPQLPGPIEIRGRVTPAGRAWLVRADGRSIQPAAGRFALTIERVRDGQHAVPVELLDGAGRVLDVREHTVLVGTEHLRSGRVADLRRALRAEGEHARRVALRAVADTHLVELAPDVRAHLAADRSAEERSEAARALAALRDVEAIPQLVGLLAASDEGLRAASGRALERLSGQSLGRVATMSAADREALAARFLQWHASNAASLRR